MIIIQHMVQQFIIAPQVDNIGRPGELTDGSQMLSQWLSSDPGPLPAQSTMFSPKWNLLRFRMIPFLNTICHIRCHLLECLFQVLCPYKSAINDQFYVPKYCGNHVIPIGVPIPTGQVLLRCSEISEFPPSHQERSYVFVLILQTNGMIPIPVCSSSFCVAHPWLAAMVVLLGSNVKLFIHSKPVSPLVSSYTPSCDTKLLDHFAQPSPAELTQHHSPT